MFSHAQIDGFAFDVELFVIVERNGLSLTELPVTVENTTCARPGARRPRRDPASSATSAASAAWLVKGSYQPDRGRDLPATSAN